MPKSRPVLDLNEYVIEQLSIDTNPAYKGDKPVETDLRIATDVAQHKDHDTKFRVSIDLRTRSITRKNTPYSVTLRVLGFFKFDEESSSEQRHRMLATNALPILYGFARGVVAQVTAQGAAGKFILP